MNILYVIPFFKPYDIGGAEVSTYLHAKMLSRDHRVIVLTPNYQHFSSREDTENENLIIHRFAFPFKPKNIMIFFDSFVFQLYLFLRVAFAIKRFDIDLVHIQSTSMIPGAFLASRLLGKKVIITIRDHGYRFTKEGLKNELRKLSGTKTLLKPWVALMMFLNHNLRKVCVRRSDRIVAVSRYMGDRVRREVGIKGDKIVVSYMPGPGWEGKPKPKKNEKFRLLFVGRLDKTKGVELLLEALRLVKGGIELLIAGNSRVGYYRKFVKTLNLKDVVFLGRIPHDKIFEVYERADAVVVPSLRGEPLSRVLIEAGSLGKPIIATDRGGSREVVINGKTGVLIKDPTPSSLAKGIEYVMNNPEKAMEMGKNIKKLVNEMFDPEKNLKIITKIYGELS